MATKALPKHLAVFAAVVLFALPAYAIDKQFGNWWAACDNLRNCSAYGFALPGNVGSYLRLERLGDPQANPTIAIGVDLTPGQKFKIAFDNPKLPGLDAQPGTPYTDRVVIDSSNIQTVIESLGKAREIIVTRTNSQGRKSDQPISKISMDGAIDALTWIDEQQARVGTVTAIFKRGNKPDTSIPAEPKSAVINVTQALKNAAGNVQPLDTDRAIIREKAASLCGKTDKGQIEDVATLSADKFLYAIYCPQASSDYNRAYLYLVASTGKARQAKLATFISPANKNSDQKIDSNKSGNKNKKTDNKKTVVQKIEPVNQMRINAAFTNIDMSLNTRVFGQEAGDCGQWQTWIWNGKAFELSMLKTMPLCKGVLADDWPIMYQAQVR